MAFIIVLTIVGLVLILSEILQHNRHDGNRGCIRISSGNGCNNIDINIGQTQFINLEALSLRFFRFDFPGKGRFREKRGGGRREVQCGFSGKKK